MSRLEESVSSLSSFGRRKTGKSRVHRKSRGGCRNCKLRSIKVRRLYHMFEFFCERLDIQATNLGQCDLFRPQCKRCVGYGVLCNYEQEYDELQSSVEGTANILRISSPSIGLPPWSDKNSELLHKFRFRTAMTVSAGRRLLLYQNQVLRLVDDVSLLTALSFSISSWYPPRSLTPRQLIEFIPETCSPHIDSYA